jgi:Domain of unknown function (DUF4082)
MTPVISPSQQPNKLYLGTQAANRAYMGSVKVWDGWTPNALPGLAFWFDAASLNIPPTTVVGPNERMLADTPLPGSLGSGNYTLGSQFTVTASGQVSHIRYPTTGDAYAPGHALSLWRSDGTKLASALDVPDPVARMHEVALPSPVAVSPGDYVATVSVDNTNYGWYTTPSSLAAHLTGPTGAYANGRDVFPTTNVGTTHYGVDVVYQTVSTGMLVNSWPNLGSGPAASIIGTPLPTVRASALKGNQVVTFLASQGRLRIGATGIDNTFTLAVVARYAGPTHQRIVGGILPNTNFLVGWWNGNMDTVYGAGAWWSSGIGPTDDGAWKLYSVDMTAGSGRMFKNGVYLQNGGGGWGNTLALSGYDGADATETSDCEIAELLIYSRQLTDADRQTVEGYLRTKWL